MSKLYIKTPLLESTPLSHKLGKPVYLKMEALQPSGSFKNRGIGYLCQHYAREGAKKFISSSGGNAGLAVAYSGRKLGIPVKVVVPKTTSSYMVDKIKLEQADVEVYGEDWYAADRYAKSLLENGNFFIPPFDHPLIWQGHSTLIEEVAEENVKPDVVIVAVGGGGLFCGVLEGLNKVGWSDVPVIAMETEGTASFSAAIKAGKVVSLKEVTGIATSLGAKEVCQEAVEWTKKHRVESQVVTDRQALDALVQFANDHRVLVEPSCGAALSPIYTKLPLLQEFTSVLVVVCGGNGISLERIKQWEKT